jgi:hypothetical protein
MPDNPREYGRRTRQHTGGILQKRREFKRERFEQKLASGYDGPVILAEGDSWFEYPMSEDLLVPLGEKFAILSLAKAGDSFTEVADQDELFPTLNEPPPGREFHIVMLSLGGNEVMGHIEDFVFDNDPARPDEKYVRLPEFEKMLIGGDGVRDKFDGIIQRIIEGGDQHVILHGYDYPDPRFPRQPGEEELPGAQWIGPPLMHHREIGSLTTYREATNQMLDGFNAMLAEVAGRPQYENRVHYVKLLGTIGKRSKTHNPDDALWVDEIHGTTEGFKRLAKKFEPVIERLWEGMQVG